MMSNIIIINAMAGRMSTLCNFIRVSEPSPLTTATDADVIRIAEHHLPKSLFETWYSADRHGMGPDRALTIRMAIPRKGGKWAVVRLRHSEAAFPRVNGVVRVTRRPSDDMLHFIRSQEQWDYPLGAISTMSGLVERMRTLGQLHRLWPEGVMSLLGTYGYRGDLAQLNPNRKSPWPKKFKVPSNLDTIRAECDHTLTKARLLFKEFPPVGRSGIGEMPVRYQPGASARITEADLYPKADR